MRRNVQVPAADQTLRILRYLSARATPTAASVLARDLQIPRSSVYHLLHALAEHGFVFHVRERQRWVLGTAAFELASGYSRQQPLARLGRPIIATLSDRLGESTHLAVMSDRDVVYIAEERAPRRPALVTDVGVRLPAHLTATGRAMLAALPRSQVRAVFPDAAAFADRTGHGPRTPAQLRELLRLVRSDGHAQENGEVQNGLQSIGVAVRDGSGWPIAAIAVTWSAEGPAPSMAVDAVTEAAELLADRLGSPGQQHPEQ
ncbi:IclR family transcriptional regulator [Microbacterium sp. YY-01]|uniref:IclR family transcriptional regulator n=1 Tax=Microbacterium sp. YY-01 TaxID=3421634 RepID=UPI003D16813E